MKASYTALARSILLSSALCVAACVPAPDSTPAPSPGPAAQAPAPSPTPTATPAPAPSVAFANWIDAPRTPGDWSIRFGSIETVAKYGVPESDPYFAMACDKRSRTITLMRAGKASAPVQAYIRTESVDRPLTMTQADANLPVVMIALPARDPLLDAMAVTRGRFAVETEGMPTLYLPPWAEVTRVIEDCR